MAALRFGLALGGGGARGFAHIPILQGLEDIGLKPDFVCGTSIGALVAALYVQYGTALLVEAKMMELMDSEPFERLGLNLIKVDDRGGASFWQQTAARMQDRIVVNLAQSKPGLVKADRVREVIAYVLKHDVWDSGSCALGIVASDLVSGEDHHFTSGDLIEAVLASMAIPGFVPPIQIGDRLLVDGGVTQLIPVRLARQMGADYVLAVDVGRSIHQDVNLDNALAIMSQSEGITAVKYREFLAQEADLVITPEFGDSHWSQFGRYEDFMQAGEKSFIAAREAILNGWKLKKHPFRERIARLFN